MRVVFDAYWWVEGPYSNQLVQRELIREWVRSYPADTAILVLPAAHRTAATDLPAGVEIVTTRLRPHGVAAAIDLGRVARRYRADVVVAHNFTPLAGPSLTFVHDVLFQTDPQWFTPAERLYFAAIPVLARRARAVATSSQTEAARIRRCNPHLRRVSAVGLAVSPALAGANPSRPHGFDVDRFVLTVSRLNVRKNLARLIDAALDSGALSPERPLVVVGEPGGRVADLGGRAADARRRGTLVFLDRVSDAELAWLYGHTDLFCYLSLDEGFGLPPVEAAWFGAPLLVSDLPVFRETVGDRAQLVDPHDRAAITAAIDGAPTRTDGAATSPIERYSWDVVVRALRDLAVASPQSAVRTTDPEAHR